MLQRLAQCAENCAHGGHLIESLPLIAALCGLHAPAVAGRRWRRLLSADFPIQRGLGRWHGAQIVYRENVYRQHDRTSILRTQACAFQHSLTGR